MTRLIAEMLTSTDWKYFKHFPSSREAAECEFSLHRAMGLMQHHDAVTGTEKQNVAEDYAFRLDKVGQLF